MAAPVGGYVFNLDAGGNPQPQGFDTSTNFAGDMSVTVTGVPAGTSAATVAALITSSPLSIPMPLKNKDQRRHKQRVGRALAAASQLVQGRKR